MRRCCVDEVRDKNEKSHGLGRIQSAPSITAVTVRDVFVCVLVCVLFSFTYGRFIYGVG